MNITFAFSAVFGPATPTFGSTRRVLRRGDATRTGLDTTFIADRTLPEGQALRRLRRALRVATRPSCSRRPSGGCSSPSATSETCSTRSSSIRGVLDGAGAPEIVRRLPRPVRQARRRDRYRRRPPLLGEHAQVLRIAGCDTSPTSRKPLPRASRVSRCSTSLGRSRGPRRYLRTTAPLRRPCRSSSMRALTPLQRRPRRHQRSGGYVNAFIGKYGLSLD